MSRAHEQGIAARIGIYAVVVVALVVGSSASPAAAAPIQRVVITFTETVFADGSVTLSCTATGGPYGSALVPGSDTLVSASLKGSLTSFTNPHQPNVPLSGIETWTFDDGSSITDRFIEVQHFQLPAGPGSTATSSGSYLILSGTGVFGSAQGNGSFDETMQFDQQMNQVGVGTAVFNVHLS